VPSTSIGRLLLTWYCARVHNTIRSPGLAACRSGWSGSTALLCALKYWPAANHARGGSGRSAKADISSSLVLPWTLYCKTCREFGTSLPSRSNESSNHEYDCSYVPRGPTSLISIQTVNGFRVRAEDVECKRGSDRYFLFASYLQRDARPTVVCVCGIIR